MAGYVIPIEILTSKLIETVAAHLRKQGWIVCPPDHVPMPQNLAQGEAMHALAEKYIQAERERQAKSRPPA